MGDQIIAVDGVSLRQVTHGEALSVLKKAGSKVTLSVTDPATVKVPQ